LKPIRKQYSSKSQGSRHSAHLTVTRRTRKNTEKPRLQVTLATCRTLEQGVGKELGKTSKEYVESVSVCYLDPCDLEKLGIEEKMSVCVSTAAGSVVLKALCSPQAPHEGLIFIPYGPWANAIVDPKTENVGMPTLKGISAEIGPANDSPLLNMTELLEKEFEKKAHAGH
jgi:formylmethanofuran dehydrogenase subunit D